MSFWSRLTHPARVEAPELETPEDVEAFIDSRALEYPSKIEDDFVQHALRLGLEGGMILDVGTRVGLIPLKILWHNENFYAIGMPSAKRFICMSERPTCWQACRAARARIRETRSALHLE